jgi:hypothetical protein
MEIGDICPDCEIETLVDDPGCPGKFLYCNECSYSEEVKCPQKTEAKGSAVAGGCEADYQPAYSWADGMMKNDEKLVAAVSGLDDGDWGTIRDRLADAYMAGKM